MHCVSICLFDIANSLTSSAGPEIWNVEGGRMTHKGKRAIVEDAFADGKSPRGSGANTPARSRIQSPAGSVMPSPAASGTEGAAEQPDGAPKKPKKKMTRNQQKAKAEQRRLAMNHWLSFGGPRPESDSD